MEQRRILFIASIQSYFDLLIEEQGKYLLSDVSVNDPEPTLEGMSQAVNIATTIHSHIKKDIYKPISKIYTSPLKRALAVSAELEKKFYAPIYATDELLGRLGTFYANIRSNYDDIKQEYPTVNLRGIHSTTIPWQSTPEKETFIIKRINEFIERITENSNPNETIAVITHPDVLSIYTGRVIRCGEMLYHDIPQTPL